MTFSQFAQATNVPTSGASNAEDFQPPTQNPQSVGGSLQQSGNAGQSTSSQDVLTNQDARIIVPTGNPAPPPKVVAQNQSMTPWIFLGLGLMVALGGAYLLIRKMSNRQTTNVPVPAVTEEQPIDAEQVKPANAPKSENTPAPKKAKPKKSKSKRKRSRK